jgi:hypothetical protein
MNRIVIYNLQERNPTPANIIPFKPCADPGYCSALAACKNLKTTKQEAQKLEYGIQQGHQIGEIQGQHNCNKNDSNPCEARHND